MGESYLSSLCVPSRLNWVDIIIIIVTSTSSFERGGGGGDRIETAAAA